MCPMCFVTLYINLYTPRFLFPLLLPHPFTSLCSLCKRISPLLTAVLVFFETKLWIIICKGDLLQQIISQSIVFGWEPQLDKQREGDITCKMESSLNKELAHLENVTLFPAEWLGITIFMLFPLEYRSHSAAIAIFLPLKQALPPTTDQLHCEISCVLLFWMLSKGFIFVHIHFYSSEPKICSWVNVFLWFVYSLLI